MKKLVSSLILVIGTVLICSIIFSPKALASATQSEVTTSFRAYSTLTSDEQKKITKANPEGTITHDKEHYTLIYEKIDLSPAKTEESVTPTATPTPAVNPSARKENTVSSSQKTLPKAGDKTETIFKIIGGGVLILAMIFYVIHRKRMNKITLLLFLILGCGILGTLSTKASTIQSLFPSKTENMVRGEKYNTPIPEIKDYKYMGYLYHYEDLPTPPIEQTGEVTVRFVDEKGQELSEHIKQVGAVGEHFTTQPKTIKDYQLKVTPENVTGIFTLEAQVVTYVYEKIDLSATLTLKFVEGGIPNRKIGDPFKIPDLTGFTHAIINGSTLPVDFATLSQYTVKMTLNNQVYTFNQKEGVNDIVLTKQLGDSYDLPTKLKWSIFDENGNPVTALVNIFSNGAMGGQAYWNVSTSDQTSGTMENKNVIITYQVISYGYATPAP